MPRKSSLTTDVQLQDGIKFDVVDVILCAELDHEIKWSSWICSCNDLSGNMLHVRVRLNEALCDMKQSGRL